MVHLVPLKECYPEFQQAILGFVVPLFLFITGYLVNIDKTRVMYVKYLAKLSVPYVIMEFAYMLVAQFLPVNNVPEIETLQDAMMVLLVYPVGPYWYLHTMIICGTVYYVIFCLHCANRLYVLIATLLSIAFFTPLLSVGVVVAYFAGVVVRRSEKEFEKIFPSTPFAFFVICITLIYSISIATDFSSWQTLYPVVMSISVISILLWLQKYVSKCRLLNFIGKNTLPIFLFHPIFTMIAKRFLTGVISFDKSVTIYTLLTIAMSIAGSLLIAYTMDIFGISICFGRHKMLR